MRSNDSILLISQLGYPGVLKRPVPAKRTDSTQGNTANGKSVTISNSAKQVVMSSGVARSARSLLVWGILVPMGFFSVWQHANCHKFLRILLACRSNGLPGNAWERPRLTIWSALVFSPQQNMAKLPFQVNGGLAIKPHPWSLRRLHLFWSCLWKVQPQLRADGRGVRPAVIRLRTCFRMESQGAVNAICVRPA